jgi:Transglycosylase SLT domain
MLASIAMEESSCNPHATGGGGEQGLMQITPDKCKGAPNGDCKNIVSFPLVGIASHVIDHYAGF